MQHQRFAGKQAQRLARQARGIEAGGNGNDEIGGGHAPILAGSAVAVAAVVVTAASAANATPAPRQPLRGSDSGVNLQERLRPRA
ncbi:hypothetical protein GCM10027564_29430 [Luteimonas notoginsengisoli]